MTAPRVPPVLVTGATGRVGRGVVDLLVDAGVPVRALTHRSEAATTLPATVDVVTGDLTVPESLDPALRGVDYRLPRLDRPAGDRSGGRRASRDLRATRRLPLGTAPDPAPLLPATEPDGGAPRRDRAAYRRRRARVDDHPAGDVRVERLVLVGARDPRRRRRPVALRRCRDGTRRRPRRGGRRGADPVRGRACRRRLRPHRPRVAESGRAGAHHRRRPGAPDPVRGAVAGRVPERDGGKLAAPGRGHAARRVGRDDGTGRRSSPRRYPTSSDRRRDRSASGSPTTPPRSRKVRPRRIDGLFGAASPPRRRCGLRRRLR